jgi:hypothetical protein
VWAEGSGDKDIKPGSLYVLPVEDFPGLGTVAEAVDTAATKSKKFFDETTDEYKLAFSLAAIEDPKIMAIVEAWIKAHKESPEGSGPVDPTFESSFKKLFGGPNEDGLAFMVAIAGNPALITGAQATTLDGAMRRNVYQYTVLEAKNKPILEKYIEDDAKANAAGLVADQKKRK